MATSWEILKVNLCHVDCFLKREGQLARCDWKISKQTEIPKKFDVNEREVVFHWNYFKNTNVSQSNVSRVSLKGLFCITSSKLRLEIAAKLSTRDRCRK